MARDNVLNKISENYRFFSKGQKRLADFILSNPDTAVFMTAAKLGQKTGISESTAVRFASNLGYEGFPEFRSALEDAVMRRMTSLQRMEAANTDFDKNKLLDSVLLSDMENLKSTLEICNRDSFQKAISLILEASKVYVIGTRSCAMLSEFLAFYLRQIIDDVSLVSSNSVNEIFEQLIRIDEKVVVIGISFPRYSMRTLKALEFASGRKSKIISITDSMDSPMNNYATCSLLAKSDRASIVDSLVAPLSLINALLVALCMHRKDEVTKTLTHMEELWAEYQVYSGEDMSTEPVVPLKEKKK